MPKMATKAADNVFYKARMAAASWNDRLASREGTSELTGIDRTRLANIELGTVNPHPDEVLMLADTYNAPELQMLSVMRCLPEVKDGIIDIAADGVIDDNERERMKEYLRMLDEIDDKIQSLKLLYRKQFGKD